MPDDSRKQVGVRDAGGAPPVHLRTAAGRPALCPAPDRTPWSDTVGYVTCPACLAAWERGERPR